MLDDTRRTRTRCARVLLCSGKVYYDLLAKRDEPSTARDVAIVRLEQLYPWPEDAAAGSAGPLPAGPRVGLGAGGVAEHGRRGRSSSRGCGLMGFPFEYVGRDASASPATGSHQVHEREQDELVEAALTAGRSPHLGRATRHAGGERHGRDGSRG